MEAQELKNLRIVIITGLSGSGKSTVSRAMEDMGFFCVDNLPIALLPKLFELRSASLGEHSKIALVMDLREKDFLKTYPEVFTWLRNEGFQLEILFLEASDEVLVRRYSQTRRTHPLAEGCGVLDGIRKEREMLANLRLMATMVIDTSIYNVHQLQGAIRDLFGQRPPGRRMSLTFLSFGYSHGIPQEADLVIDARFLPNPYFVEELKYYDGHHPHVRDYVLESDESKIFIQKLFDMMAFLIPLYEKEGKARLNIALGCTGGRHRSVVMANQLGSYFSDKNYLITINHRDITKS